MGVRVLLVDDEVGFTAALRKRLGVRGIDAACASSGPAALAHLEKEACDVVVLDVLMPGMSGMEVLREIKRRRPDTEVIMLTGHASVDVAVEGIEQGAFDYLMKPIELDELVYKIEDARQARALRLESGGTDTGGD